MAFQLPKQSIVKGSVFHKSVLKARKSALKQEEEVVEEPKRNLFENIFSKEAREERRAKRNPEGKSPHEIKLEKELERMQNFGDASKFEIKAMERRLGRAQADRLASVEEGAAAAPEAAKPTGYYTEGSQVYLNRFKEGGDLADRQKPEGWWDPESPNYGGEIEGKVPGDVSRPTGYYDKTSKNYMKGVETRNLADMKFLSPERKAYYEARNWAPDKTVDPNFENPPPPPPPPPKKETKKETKKKVEKKLRFPELGKYDYRNAVDYRGTDPSYPLP